MGDLIYLSKKRAALATNPGRLATTTKDHLMSTAEYTLPSVRGRDPFLNAEYEAMLARLQALGDVREVRVDNALHYVAACPTHGDQKLSLLWRYGGPLTDCDCDCTFSDVFTALGLTIGDVSQGVSKGGETDDPAETSVAEDSLQGVSKVVDVSKDVSMGIDDLVDKTRARAKALKISLDPDSMDEAFDCPIPGHDHEAAMVWYPGATFWRVRCGESRKSYGLAEIRAAIAYGELRHLSVPEASRWLERLDYEAGLLEPAPIELEVPENVSATAQEIARGIRLYLGLRAARGGFAPAEPYTFARKFTMAYCDVSDDQARDGMRQLRGCGFVKWTGDKVGRALVWRLPVVSKQSEVYWQKAA